MNANRIDLKISGEKIALRATMGLQLLESSCMRYELNFKQGWFWLDYEIVTKRL